MREAPCGNRFRWAAVPIALLLSSSFFLTVAAEPRTEEYTIEWNHKLVLTYDMSRGDVLHWEWSVTDGNGSIIFALFDENSGEQLALNISREGSGQRESTNSSKWSLVWCNMNLNKVRVRFTVEVNPVSEFLVNGTFQVMLAVPFLTGSFIMFRKRK